RGRGRRGDRRRVQVIRHAEVIIIGGGVTGASIAFHLTAVGARDVLLLERKFLASGGTGRSVGIVRQLYPTPETSQMVVRSLAVFQGFSDAVGGESGYVDCGVLIGVSTAMRPKLEETVRRQRSFGVRAEVLEPGELARIEPRIDSEHLGAVLYEPESGYGDPTAVTTGYAAAARRRGVRIEQGVEVVAIRTAGDRVTGVETAAGDRIDAPVVVNAAGLWSGAVARLADARYRRGWAGAFDITPDWMPILDESPIRGFWIATGMSGHGFKLAPAVGEMMAALITGAAPPVNSAPFAFGRFTAESPSGTFVASYLG